ncbi:hypothetical protein PR048_015739 [Dryococelus australis]|uniref:Uncharacterized protein n=1 Tax=Dryococelus australis TaxID=614101 RepID=A0ABQ9HI25_9NEOP|nr:hypothetical protein PR048_015739 [Dryococelus australis]
MSSGGVFLPASIPGLPRRTTSDQGSNILTSLLALTLGHLGHYLPQLSDPAQPCGRKRIRRSLRRCQNKVKTREDVTEANMTVEAEAHEVLRRRIFVVMECVSVRPDGRSTDSLNALGEKSHMCVVVDTVYDRMMRLLLFLFRNNDDIQSLPSPLCPTCSRSGQLSKRTADYRPFTHKLAVCSQIHITRSREMRERQITNIYSLPCYEIFSFELGNLNVFLRGQEETASDTEVHAHTSGMAAGFIVTVSLNCLSQRLITSSAARERRVGAPRWVTWRLA